MKHQETAQEIIKAVGGTNNINSVYHCVTRLRFDLKNNEKSITAHSRNWIRSWEQIFPAINSKSLSVMMWQKYSMPW